MVITIIQFRLGQLVGLLCNLPSTFPSGTYDEYSGQINGAINADPTYAAAFLGTQITTILFLIMAVMALIHSK
jgi:hypothetical protein